MGVTNWQGLSFFFASRVAQHGFWRSCWPRVSIYVCVKCGHASALHRLDGRPKAKGRYTACPECPYAGYATALKLYWHAYSSYKTSAYVGLSACRALLNPPFQSAMLWRRWPDIPCSGTPCPSVRRPVTAALPPRMMSSPDMSTARAPEPTAAGSLISAVQSSNHPAVASMRHTAYGPVSPAHVRRPGPGGVKIIHLMEMGCSDL